MTDNCLDCESVREQICDLLSVISNLEGCEGVVVESNGTKFDYRGQLEGKYKALEILEKLEARLCPKGELYEFTQAVCTYPVNCGSGCSTARSQSRNRRRYK